jgi:hypothetical protein
VHAFTPMGSWRARAASTALGALRGNATRTTAHVVQPPLASFATLAAASRCLERPIHHSPSLAAAAAVQYRAWGHHLEPVRAERPPSPTITLPWSAVAAPLRTVGQNVGVCPVDRTRRHAVSGPRRSSIRALLLSAGRRIGFSAVLHATTRAWLRLLAVGIGLDESNSIRFAFTRTPRPPHLWTGPNPNIPTESSAAAALSNTCCRCILEHTDAVDVDGLGVHAQAAPVHRPQWTRVLSTSTAAWQRQDETTDVEDDPDETVESLLQELEESSDDEVPCCPSR